VTRAAHDYRGLSLLKERAIWREDSRTLWVADVHLGKAATFRALGQPVPAGTTTDNLNRLSALIDFHRASRLVFLGDLFHAPQSHIAAARAFRAWRDRHKDLELVLVRGNHERRAGDPAPELRIEVVAEPYSSDAIEARHHPLQAEEALTERGETVLAGHLHPVVCIRGAGHDSIRAQCFVLHGRQIILPAFGEFTGGARTARTMNVCAITEAGMIYIEGDRGV